MPEPYDPRWAEDGERSPPSDVDIAAGFPCGALSRGLFNWLFWEVFGRFNTLWNRTVSTPGSGGLAGGGDLSADRTLTTEWSGLTAQTAIANADLFNMRDVSASAQVKVTFLELKNEILLDATDLSGREVNTSKGLSGGGDLSADRTIITDWTSGLTAIPAIADGDLVNVRDISAAAGAGDQRAATMAQITDFVLDGVVDGIDGQPGSADILNADQFVIEATRPIGAVQRNMTSTFQAWRLNSVVTNDIVGASIHPTTYYITLPAGRYRVFYGGAANSAGSHQIRLYNRTTSAEIGHGLIQDSFVANGVTGVTNTTNTSFGVAVFTLTAVTEISLDHACLNDSPGAAFGDGNDLFVRYDAFIRIEREKGTV